LRPRLAKLRSLSFTISNSGVSLVLAKRYSFVRKGYGYGLDSSTTTARRCKF
jgi:hypothetical protein